MFTSISEGFVGVTSGKKELITYRKTLNIGTFTYFLSQIIHHEGTVCGKFVAKTVTDIDRPVQKFLLKTRRLTEWY